VRQSDNCAGLGLAIPNVEHNFSVSCRILRVYTHGLLCNFRLKKKLQNADDLYPGPGGESCGLQAVIPDKVR
jgi:hypothetical protein